MLTFPPGNWNHRNLHGSAAVLGMSRLCIAGDHESSSLHRRGLRICRKSDTEMVTRYAKAIDRGHQLCKHVIPVRLEQAADGIAAQGGCSTNSSGVSRRPGS